MPEQDFLTRIKETEAAAEALVAEAADQGKRSLEKARQDALERITKAQHEADQQLHQRLHAAEQKAAALIAKSRSEAEQAALDIAGEAKPRVAAASKALQERIVSDSVHR